MRKTKICCTIGPASADPEIIEQLITAGMDVARLNFSQGSLQTHGKAIKMIRQASEKLGVPIAIMQDLQGPKIRIGEVENNAIDLVRGKELTITTNKIVGTSSELFTSYKGLPKDVNVGDRILLDDGNIQLKVISKQENAVRCRVLVGGPVASHKGLNLPGVDVSIPALTNKDKVDLPFGIRNKVDIIAVSFVRRAEDMVQVRKIVEKSSHDATVIAKFEKPEAVENLESILSQSDGTIVARGDLGVELALERVPPVQRRIVEKCRGQGIPSIIATQMLESMRTNMRPTRAEVSDVANAIYGGADSVMLTAETAIGDHPVHTVKTLTRIIKAAEQDLGNILSLPKLSSKNKVTTADAVAASTCHAAYNLKVKAIVTLTQSGYTARMISKYRPLAPIIACTPNVSVWRQMNLLWGVIPKKMSFAGDIEKIISRIDEMLRNDKLAKNGDLIVLVMGLPLPERGTTNLMTIHEVGS